MSSAFKLPEEPRGFAVDPTSGRVHRRHAAHAIGLPRTSARGIAALTSKPLVGCEECFPQPKVTKKVSASRRLPVPVEPPAEEPEAPPEVELDVGSDEEAIEMPPPAEVVDGD